MAEHGTRPSLLQESEKGLELTGLGVEKVILRRPLQVNQTKLDNGFTEVRSIKFPVLYGLSRDPEVAAEMLAGMVINYHQFLALEEGKLKNMGVEETKVMTIERRRQYRSIRTYLSFPKKKKV
jgi:hypothetical protein